MKLRPHGFSLIEMMVAVAVIAILSAIAVPAYSDYVIRGRLTEAFAALAGAQPSAEQFWSNNRTFVGLTPLPANTSNFTYALSGASASAYTLTATGAGSVAGFVFTIDQSGTRATTAAPSGWGTNAGCWVDRKGGACSQ